MPAPLPLSPEHEALVHHWRRECRTVWIEPSANMWAAARRFCYHIGPEQWPSLSLERQVRLPAAQRAFVGWLMVTGQLAAGPDYLVVCRPHLGELGAKHHRDLHETITTTARDLGYATVDMVQGIWAALIKTAAITRTRPQRLGPADLDTAQQALREARARHARQHPHWPSREDNARDHWTALRTVLFHAGLTDQPPAPVTRNSRQAKRDVGWATITPGIAATMRTYLDQVAVSGARPSTCRRDERVLREFGLYVTRTAPDVEAIAQVTRRQVEGYKKYVATRPCVRGGTLSATSVGHTLNALSVFFDRLTEWDHPDRPIGRLLFAGDYPRKDKPLPRFLDDAAAAKLLAAARADEDLFTRLVIEILARTGLRRGELIGLRTNAIVQIGSAYWLRVPLGKMRTDRYVPLHPQLKTLIDEWLAQRPACLRSDLLFTEHGRRIDSARIDRVLKRVARTAGIGHVHPHQLRHTLATQAVNRGMSMEAIAALLGHKDLSMTQVYAKVAN